MNFSKDPVRNPKSALYAILLTLFLVSNALADKSKGWSIESGELKFDGGKLYVPSDLRWDPLPIENGVLLLGTLDGSNTVCISVINQQNTVDNDTALSLLQSHLVTPLQARAEQAASLATLRVERQLTPAEQSYAELISLSGKLPFKKTLSAPYPWPQSLEVRLDTQIPISCYISSGSEKTLIITALGSEGPSIANSIAASYKEKLSAKRDIEARKNSASHIQTLLGTGNSFLLLFCLIVPLSLGLVLNRRHGVNTNPFDRGLKGLVVGAVLALAFSYLMLSRFSWAGILDYVQTFGGTAVRFGFLYAAGLYFSKRWDARLEQEE